MKHHHLKSPRHNPPANRNDFLNGTPREHVFQDTPAQLDLHTGWLQHVSYEIGKCSLWMKVFGCNLPMFFLLHWVRQQDSRFSFEYVQCSSHLACALIGLPTDMQAYAQSQNPSYLHSSAAKLDKITHKAHPHVGMFSITHPIRNKISMKWTNSRSWCSQHCSVR